MKKILSILIALIVLGIVAALALAYAPFKPTPANETLAADWKAEPGRGEYVMRAGDCMACHTANGGESMAGGRGIESPLGTIWSSNITPDKETGIGNWTLDQFRAAMVDGVGGHGQQLYPAMPYENYRFMTESDLRALYDYIQTEVKPVKNEVQATSLTFPFNMRFGLRAWNWLALSGEAKFKPMAGDEQQIRGQYLIEGAGHCAACHSPRTTFMAQDGTRLSDASFLTGGMVDEWTAPALRGKDARVQKWTAEEIAAYLATGRNAHAVANGEMALVVEHSMQYMTDADLNAMAVFLKSMDGQPVEAVPAKVAAAGPRSMPALPADEAGKATATLLTSASPDMPVGARLYLDNCAACHFVSGKGAPEIFPELQGNAMVLGKDANPFVSVILNGTSVPSTSRRPMHLAMQGYADRLTDEEVAQLASFIRNGWGNKASNVSASDVSKVRKHTQAAAAPERAQ
ncbi:c-type cytochrome [Comamonas sp. 17RB]|uniref:c-type cytochrome n=1 Tax=Comamonas sp. 17RB TaxID=3047025 RepID=UPI0024B6E501|nr:c-type cytochrome [Comamonas sp. 17RB]MDI9854426.1 c-type cytochrome [Comamonas sp. 17RB]